jgi:GT2 family glycosyltransferase
MNMIWQNSDNIKFEIISEEDTGRIGCPKMVKLLVAKTKYDLVMFLGDDTLPQPDFLKNALAAMATLPDGWGLVGLNDQTDRPVATHWLADKRLLPLLDGEFFHTGYQHCFCDGELRARCEELGRFVFAKNAVVDHDNPILTDGAQYDQEKYKHDRRLFYDRWRNGWGHNIGAVKLGIGLPLTDNKVHTQFFTSFTCMAKPDFTLYLPQFPGQIDLVRNSIVSQAMNDGCTHLLMMDTDQIYPVDTLEKLLSHEADTCGVLVHRRYPPFAPICYRGKVGEFEYVGDEEMFSGGLIPVDATGCGCLLFNCTVFNEITQPWFEIKYKDDGSPIGEDIGFCQKLRDQGFEIYVDTSIAVGHLTQMEVNRSTYEIFKTINGGKEK